MLEGQGVLPAGTGVVPPRVCAALGTETDRLCAGSNAPPRPLLAPPLPPAVVPVAPEQGVPLALTVVVCWLCAALPDAVALELSAVVPSAVVPRPVVPSLVEPSDAVALPVGAVEAEFEPVFAPVAAAPDDADDAADVVAAVVVMPEADVEACPPQLAAPGVAKAGLPGVDADAPAVPNPGATIPPPSNVELTALAEDAGQGIGFSIPKLRSADPCGSSIETPVPASSGDVVPMPPDVVVPACAQHGGISAARAASITAVRKSLVRPPCHLQMMRPGSALLRPIARLAQESRQRIVLRGHAIRGTQCNAELAKTIHRFGTLLRERRRLRPARDHAGPKHSDVQATEGGSAGTVMCQGGMAGAMSGPSPWVAR